MLSDTKTRIRFRIELAAAVAAVVLLGMALAAAVKFFCHWAPSGEGRGPGQACQLARVVDAFASAVLSLLS